MRQRTEHEILIGIYLDELKLEHFREYRFHDTRAWRFDFAIPSHMLAIELEGGIHPFRDKRGNLVMQGGHTTGRGYQQNLDKYNEATALGWRLFRFSVEDVKTGKAKQVLARWLKPGDTDEMRIMQWSRVGD